MKHTIIFLILCISTLDASARLQIRREGSPTMLPFTQEVSDLFVAKTHNLDPLISSNGSGVGIQKFCANKNIFSPDVVSAVRPMKKEELEQCFKNGVTNIVKLNTGKNGLCFLHSKEALDKQKIEKFSLTTNQLFLAIIKDVPTNDGKLTPNPYEKWSDIHPSLPNAPIKVHVPSPWQGTRGDLETMILDPNCKKIDWVKDLQTKDPKRYIQICHSLREDVHTTTIKDYELDEDAVVLVDELGHMPLGEVVTIGCNLYMLHQKEPIQSLEIDNVEASVKNLKNGSYPLIYPLQMYFNKDRFKMVAGLEDYLKFFSLPENIGPNGLVTKHGFLAEDLSKNPIIEINPQNPIT